MIELLLLLETEEDRVQFKDLYEATYLKLLYTAKGILHDMDDAEETVHDIYVKIAEDFPKYRDKSIEEMLSLGIVMTRNACINLMKSRIRRKEVSLEPNEFYLTDDSDLLDKMIKEEGIDVLRKAFRQLNVEDRDILILKYYHDMSYKEIARVLHMREKSVDMRLYRVKNKLKKLMAKQHYKK